MNLCSNELVIRERSSQTHKELLGLDWIEEWRAENALDTSISLIENLQRNPDDDGWRELLELYTPLMKAWMLRFGANRQDLDDVVQEVMAVVVKRFPEFKREPHKGAFRGWLRKITANCLKKQWRGAKKSPRPVGGSDFAEMVEALQDPNSGVSRIWEREHDQHVLKYLLSSIRHEFKDATWQAFQLTAQEGKTADEAAEQLGITPNAVFIARSRVLARLRSRSQGLTEL